MEYNLIIDGEKVATKTTFDVINPATEEVICQCPNATEDNLNSAMAAARAAFPAWSQTSDEERQEKLNALADIISNNMNDLASLITQEMGRPLEGLAFGAFAEVGGAEYWTRMTAGLSLPVEIAEDTEEHTAEIHRKPLGVVASSSPLMYRGNLSLPAIVIF